MYSASCKTSLLHEEISKQPYQLSSSRVFQNFVLIWLDSTIDKWNDNEFRNDISSLRPIVNNIYVFADADQCIDFITDIKEEKVLMILSDDFGRKLVPIVHSLIQINSIYIFSKNGSENKQWIQEWPIVRGRFTSIPYIIEILKQDVQTCDQNLLSISFISSNSEEVTDNLDRLEPTFMHTQILKEILLIIDFKQQHMKDFVSYYHEIFSDNITESNNINDFEKNYYNKSPIWWYTHPWCLYSMLNRALRLMEVDTIIKIGFFICDLHQQIAHLHSKQLSKLHSLETFTIYRGQTLLKNDFEKLQKMQGGLIAFNNFLSTSKDLTVALDFARSTPINPSLMGIVFVITIDPTIKSTPFASIRDFSYYKREDEILFSMHTVFRIISVIKIDDSDRLWQIDLIQTKDNDPDLNNLTERIRKEIETTPVAWDRLGRWLIKIRKFDKAAELYKVLLDQTSSDRNKINYYDQIGWCKKNGTEYDEAIKFYQNALELKQLIMPSNFSSLATSFKELGSVHEAKNEYTKALLYYEKGLEIQQNADPPNQLGLASSYSSIGSIYKKLCDYAKALEFHKKALEIRQNLVPVNNAHLADSHMNIGTIYTNMGNYSQALICHEKALKIRKEILPSNHIDLARSYDTIGSVYSKMGQSSEARQYYQQAVDIGQRSLLADDSRLQQWQKKLKFHKQKHA